MPYPVEGYGHDYGQHHFRTLLLTRTARQSPPIAQRYLRPSVSRSQHHPVSHCTAMMAGMEFIGHFSPWLAQHRPCWHCVHFDGMLFGGSAAGCKAPGSAQVRAMPADGCSRWEREPGSDDEPGPPVIAKTPQMGDCAIAVIWLTIML